MLLDYLKNPAFVAAAVAVLAALLNLTGVMELGAAAQAAVVDAILNIVAGVAAVAAAIFKLPE